jgi:hypothetical protein
MLKILGIRAMIGLEKGNWLWSRRRLEIEWLNDVE